MSKHKKIEKAKADKAAQLKAERDRMEQFCINDFGPMKGFKQLEKYEAWVAKIKAMTLPELVKEFNKRDGDHVLQHGCPPEVIDGEQIP
jgi:hypothetical protein